MHSSCAVELCAVEYGISVLCKCIVRCSLVQFMQGYVANGAVK